MRNTLDLSERRICRVLGQHRSTQRRRPRGRADEDRLVADMIELVRQYGRGAFMRSVVLALLMGLGLAFIWTSSAHAEKRVALVIGNDKYRLLPGLSCMAIPLSCGVCGPYFS